MLLPFGSHQAPLYRCFRQGIRASAPSSDRLQPGTEEIGIWGTCTGSPSGPLGPLPRCGFDTKHQKGRGGACASSPYDMTLPTGVPQLQENAPPWDPTVGLCPGSWGVPRGWVFSYGRGAPVASVVADVL